MKIESMSNRAYFEDRLRRNRSLAERSQNPAIRTIHLEYARLYEQLLQNSPRTDRAV